MASRSFQIVSRSTMATTVMDFTSHDPQGNIMHPSFASWKNEMLCCCRYSDYYNCGFSLAARQVEGSFLMSFALMGRPYPVTQHPFPKPATHQPPLHAQANALDNGLLGRSCDEHPHRCCLLNDASIFTLSLMYVLFTDAAALTATTAIT
jgi:hypothetical protein